MQLTLGPLLQNELYNNVIFFLEDGLPVVAGRLDVHV
jgi:hypothetical protein